MKLHIEIDTQDTDPKVRSILAILAGSVAAVASSVQMTEDHKNAEVNRADDAARQKLQDDRDAAAANDAAIEAEEVKAKAKAENDAAVAKGKADAAATAKAKAEAGTESTAGAGEIKLESLQELAAQLLAAGERRTFRALLDEVGVKSLSTADVSLYPQLLEALQMSVDNLPAA